MAKNGRSGEKDAGLSRFRRVGEVDRSGQGRAPVPGGSRRTAVSRHRTLRAVLDWSYELLGESRRTLLRRLSVFR